MSAEPKEFSRAIENLIADLRQVPGDRSRSKRRAPIRLSVDHDIA